MSRRSGIGLFVLTAALGLAFGCGSPQPAKPTDLKPTDPKPTGGGPFVPLVELLAQLPKDHWPKDGADSLRCEKAQAWFKSNVVGRRAVWPIPQDVNRDFRFSLNETSGKYKASLGGVSPTVKLFQGEWRLSVWSPSAPWVPNYHVPDYHVSVKGLSEPAAERLRRWVGGPPLEVTVSVKGVGFVQPLSEAIVVVSVEDDVSLTGFID